MTETVFTYAAPGLKFGPGASAEIGHDLAATGARRVLLVTDAGVAATGHPARIADQMPRPRASTSRRTTRRGSSRPTRRCATRSRSPATPGPFDAIVAVGGGSSIDTAKAVNLLTTNPGELLDYVNAAGRRRPGADRAAAAAGRRADDDRDRQREHHDLRARRARPAGEDRHQPPAAAADARRWSTPT